MTNKITSGAHTFEIVDYVPEGCQIWNISGVTGGYLPLAEVENYKVNTETLKAIKIENADALTRIRKAVSQGGSTLETIERYIKRYPNPKSASARIKVQRYRDALDDMQAIQWGEPEETTPEVETAEPEESQGLTVEISYNEEKNGIELKFEGKPSAEVRENLKLNGFRWSRYQKIWYAKDTGARREFIKQFEGEEVEKQKFEYPEIDINDLDNYTVSAELARREHDSNWVFRTKERDHNGDLRSTLEHYQNEALEIIKSTDDKATIYYIKRDLQRFKKAYHSNYIALLTNKANNPSWAVTGRAGRNTRRDQQAFDRYGRLLEEYGEIKDKFETQLRRHEGRISKAAKKNKFKQIENTNIEIDFTVKNKEITYLGVTETKRTYNYKNYMIAKLWGGYKLFKDGGEVPRHIVSLRTTDTLETAKKALQMVINNEKKEIQAAI